MPTHNTCKQFAIYPGETVGYCTAGNNDSIVKCPHCGLPIDLIQAWQYYDGWACDKYKRDKGKRISHNDWIRRGKPEYINPYNVAKANRAKVLEEAPDAGM